MVSTTFSKFQPSFLTLEIAARAGLEPATSDPKSDVLPLNYLAMIVLILSSIFSKLIRNLVNL